VTHKQLIKRLQKEQDALAKRRDAFREIIDEAESMEESCIKAIGGLQEAIDALSEFV
jgi:hypothetical protein